jgi:hypothetical protein
MKDDDFQSWDFADAFEVKPPDMEVGYRIASTGQLKAWASDQLAVWSSFAGISRSPQNGFTRFANSLSQLSEQLCESCRNLEQLAAKSSGEFSLNDSQYISNIKIIRRNLDAVSSGNIPIRDSTIGARAIGLMKADLVAAAILLYITRDAAKGELGPLPDGTPLAVLLRGVAIASASEGVNEFLTSAVKSFHAARAQADQDLSDFRSNREAEISRQNIFWEDTELRVDKHAQAFDERLKTVNEEWETQKRVYDEKLALLAPATYWESKQIRHRWFALGYGSVFALFIAIGLCCFVRFGVDVLSKASEQAAQGTAYVPRLLEVLIPAFLGVWILRILGRMLATHLQLWEDARERLTMVKTFLALMRDSQRGALVKDEDRILILSALFRHSSPSSVDDAPPASWFDVLMTRIKADKS